MHSAPIPEAGCSSAIPKQAKIAYLWILGLLLFVGSGARAQTATFSFPGGALLTTDGSTALDVGQYSSPAVTDVDGDGLIDLLTGSSDGEIVRFEQTTSNGLVFALVGNLTTDGTTVLDVGTYAAPTVRDINGNGLLDLLVGNDQGRVARYEQTTSNGPAFALVGNLTTDGSTTLDVGNFSTPTVTDLDNDGLLDLLVGTHIGNVRRYEQTTTNGVVFAGGDFLTTDGSTALLVGPGEGDGEANPEVEDLDGDGLLDLLVGEKLGRVEHFEQTTVNGTVFARIGYLTTNGSSILDVRQFSAPRITDVDGNGVFDLLAGGYNGNVQRFELAYLPVLTSIAPASSVTGISVTLTGNYLSNATGIKFNGTSATTFTVNSANEIVVVVPSGATTGDVVVTTPPGSSNGIPFTVLPPSADLSITKTDGVTTATPGGSVTYTITASNAGPSSVVGATVADTYPASLTGVTWTCVGAGGGTCTASGSGNLNDAVNLPSGGSVTYTVSANISPSATGTLSNTATVSTPQGVSDPVSGNNSATDSDQLSPSADLSIAKTDGVTTATPGGSVTYTITASNAGPSSVVGATVADTYPASLTGVTWTCVGAGGGTCTASGSGNLNDAVNLPSGGSVTYTISANISPSATTPGTLSNTATVTAPQGVSDPNSNNNSATDTDNLVCPTITFTNPTITDVLCIGTSTGSISLSASGSSGTATYTLNPGNVQNTTGTFTGLPTGTYTVAVTYLSGCSATSDFITINQPAAIALNTDGDKSVILGYGDNCTTLTATASGGTGNHTYTWMPGGLAGSSVQVCPQVTTTYTVTSTDANGCTASQQVTVTVNDVRCGNKNQNVTICYYGVTQCVSEKIAKRYLRLGATIGGCGNNARIGVEETTNAPLQLSVKAFPNPVQDAVTLEVLAPGAGVATFQVLDLTGRTRQTKSKHLVEGLNEVGFRLGTLPAGMYLIRAVDALNRQGVVKVSKQ
ncbi:FG-GAP-like repeat-containing protein [Persicitalea jodogahamensis]|uniref:DUF11 domain-containing protein n=1 Tax=Persicitalea jodogahamensis TaxID=402147 RepID=A0A8J3D2F1_9BACT|nr:FG-GAP-like repeat-containing protein [Persicitalea jodogahamensis]GHB58136.1 hypothetical protein GCM10007390_09510 [Persicitalea jodogahamensis]